MNDLAQTSKRLWFAIVCTACIVGFLLGYATSAKTGVEPGFFEIAESGGYGVAATKSSNTGLSSEMESYYNELNE